MNRIGQSGRRTPKIADRTEKALGVLAFTMNQDGVVEILRGEDLAAVGGPTDAELVQEITRHLNDPGFDQNLGGGNVQLLDQLQDLREEMDIGRDEKSIAALVRHDANAANQVADRAGGAGVGGARVILLSAKPGEIAFILGFLIELEVV